MIYYCLLWISYFSIKDDISILLRSVGYGVASQSELQYRMLIWLINGWRSMANTKFDAITKMSMSVLLLSNVCFKAKCLIRRSRFECNALNFCYQHGKTWVLYQRKHFNLSVLDSAQVQFNNMCNKAAAGLCLRFDYFSNKTAVSPSLWNNWQQDRIQWSMVCDKVCHVLSLGIAAVLSGFNRDILIENLHEECVVAQRQVYDIVREAGGVTEVTADGKIQDIVHPRSQWEIYGKIVKKRKVWMKYLKEMRIESGIESELLIK